MKRLEGCAAAWLLAYLLPSVLGYSARAAAVCCVLVMALTAPVILLAVEDIRNDKGTR